MSRPGLILQEVKPGVHRWTSVEAVLRPHADDPDHARILARHAAAYDDLAARQRERGADLDEPGLAQAKEDHLTLVAHMLTHLPPEQGQRLGRLRVLPWDGENDTLYNPHHHAVFLGSEALAGGYTRYTDRLGHMVAHELAHAVDFEGGKSRLGEALKAKLSRAPVARGALPPRLRVALEDPTEWGPRLLELALERPAKFSEVARELKRSHGLDLRALMHEHLGVKVPVHRRSVREIAESRRKETP